MSQGETQRDPLVGQTIAGKYKVIRLLGEGGMGCVYQAEQKLGSAARSVALKTLHTHLSHDLAIKARFHREAGTVAALQHPNTIQIYDFGEMPDGTLYLVMEFIHGRSVADVLTKDGPMPPERVVTIMRQVCGSLEEAHGHGIVHRDLKPDNIVLSERAGQRDWVEVLDFGIAKRSSDQDPNEAKLTQQGMVLGTPPYMSPEQFTGQPVDLRSDIYSLGIMAYEMLVGKFPFEANTAWEWASRHMTEAPRPIETQPLGPQVPAGIRRAISRALSKRKEDRFPSVKEFFDEFSSDGGIPVAPGVRDLQARAKTELAQPLMTPSPPYGQTMSAPAVYAHEAPAAGVVPPVSGRKMGAGPVVALGALAVLLLGGSVAAAVFSGKKPVATAEIAPSPAAQASVPAEPPAPAPSADEPGGGAPSSVESVPPLGAGPTKVAAPTSVRADLGLKAPAPRPPETPRAPAPPATPVEKPATPVEKPAEKPAERPEPVVCVQARLARARNNPMAPRLERMCAAALSARP